MLPALGNSQHKGKDLKHMKDWRSTKKTSHQVEQLTNCEAKHVGAEKKVGMMEWSDPSGMD